MSEISFVYSCGTCRVRFPTLEPMQAHYKCDWHRYNLKRKVANLPPISAEQFAEIVKSYQAEKTSGPNNDSSNVQAEKLYCKVCAKSFQTAGSYTSHLESKKHLDKLKTFDGDDQAEEKDPVEERSSTEKTESVTGTPETVAEDALPVGDNEDDWEDENEHDQDADLPPYDVSICVFCSKKSSSLESNLKHMSSGHSFFVPDFIYCIDVSGLIDYLGKKVTDGNMCLFCNQRFQDTTAAQRHMDSKGHTKICYEGNSLLEYEEFYDFAAENENENRSSTSDDSAVLDGTGYEMTLPSGATIGHRELSRYYKQGLRPVRDVALVRNLQGHYKALGWQSNEQGMGYAQGMMKELNRLRKERQKKRLHIGMQTNKIMMKHYRRQYGF